MPTTMTIPMTITIARSCVGDNGSLYFWDWKSGYNYQQAMTTVQPGSLDAEAGIMATCFDQTGTRLITCEADKTVKIWKQDPDAVCTHPHDDALEIYGVCVCVCQTPETHPIDMEKVRKQQRTHRY